MFITKKHLHRRTFLQAAGATVALPLLDAMVPARTLLAATAAKPASRLGFVYLPHGAIMDQLDAGAGRRRLRVLADPQAARAVPRTRRHRLRPRPSRRRHLRRPLAEPDNVAERRAAEADAGRRRYAGITADQIAAMKIGQDTPLPSIEIATEDQSGLIGSCDRDYGCIYMNTLSWRTPTTPMPMEINPRKVFERMFGQGGSAGRAAGAARRRQEHSRRAHAADHAICSAASDRKTKSRSTTTSRACARSSAGSRSRARSSRSRSTCRRRPVGIPFNFEEHIKLMYDLMALAYQANITRVFTYMVAREESNKTYPMIDVHEGHHATSHHQNRPEKIEKLVKIQHVPHRPVRRLPAEAEFDPGRRRHAARPLAASSTAAT